MLVCYLKKRYMLLRERQMLLEVDMNVTSRGDICYLKRCMLPKEEIHVT